MTVIPERAAILGKPIVLALSLTTPDGSEITVTGDIPADARVVRAYFMSLADTLHDQLVDQGWLVSGIRTDRPVGE